MRASKMIGPHPVSGKCLHWYSYAFEFLLTAFVFTVHKACAEVRSPFRVIWNYPDVPCQNRGYDFELYKYGIVRNSNMQFIGNEIATLYTDRFGLFPYFQNNDLTQPVNGGLPQLGNLTAHLEEFEKNILDVVGPDYRGYGVLDMEKWRPLLDLNWGKQRVYAAASRDLVTQLYPSLTLNEINTEAAAEFDESARALMLKSVEILQAARPNVHWGYYLYPYLWSDTVGTEKTNARLSWLYETVNGYYPSIYIKNVRGTSVAVMETKVKGILAESFRVKSLYGRQDSILAPYALVQNDEDVFFEEPDLYYAIGMAADMGADAVVLWGASAYLRGNGCANIKAYVQNTLGPYVKKILEKANTCSMTQCTGHGRCVRKDYAEMYPYIQWVNHGFQIRQSPAEKSVTDSGTYDYPGLLSLLGVNNTSGDTTKDRSVPSVSEDGSLLGISSEPQDSSTTWEDEQMQTYGDTTYSVSGQQYDQDISNMDYVCQCYSDWIGSSCEIPIYTSN